jgi:hypothetical protein
MARFGQGFLNALTQPSYMQGLFDLGKAAGSLPGRAREERNKNDAMAAATSAFSSESPSEILQAAQAVQEFDPALAEQLRNRALTLRQQRANLQPVTAPKPRDFSIEQKQMDNAVAKRKRLEQNVMGVIQRSNRSEEDKRRLMEGYLGASTEDLIDFLRTGGPQKEGSQAKGNKTEKVILEDGKQVSYVVTTDPYTGEELGRVKVGEVPVDEDNKTAVGRADWKGPDKEAWRDATDEARKSSLNSVKYSDLLNETLNMVEEGGQVGGFLGTARDFVLSDVAGLGDAVSIHRARLNEVRMQNAIALLPRGPASDRDVALALDASVNPKDLKPEQRVSYIRGMKKIADAEKEYTEGKLRYIEDTGDAMAFGYDRYVQLKGAEKQLEAFKTENSVVVEEVEKDLNDVRTLISQGKEEEAKALLSAIKAVDTTGYLERLENLERLNNNWQTFAESNNISL